LFAAISSVVNIAEILKNNGLAVEKSKKNSLSIHNQICMQFHYYIEIMSTSQSLSVLFLNPHQSLFSELSYFLPLAEIRTSTVEISDEMRGRSVQKAKVRTTKIPPQISDDMHQSVVSAKFLFIFIPCPSCLKTLTPSCACRLKLCCERRKTLMS
jgi:hypothetical protein